MDLLGHAEVLLEYSESAKRTIVKFRHTTAIE